MDLLAFRRRNGFHTLLNVNPPHLQSIFLCGVDGIKEVNGKCAKNYELWVMISCELYENYKKKKLSTAMMSNKHAINER